MWKQQTQSEFSDANQAFSAHIRNIYSEGGVTFQLQEGSILTGDSHLANP